jgi:2-oxoisovalerate dehydrogenase E1 component
MTTLTPTSSKSTKSKQELTPDDMIADYRLAYRSRQASLIGRREVLSGRAKFGIFGDGKEVAQLALARAFHTGDFRSGYYRDQTFMFAIGALTIQQFFAQLYAHTDLEAEPMSGGRLMNAHFATRSLNRDGTWRDLTAQPNSASDVSPTASQMPRLVGLAYASRLYREIEALHSFAQFSNHGREVAFGTIGNASCAEGMFWEAVNAIGVLKAPAVISIWDDGYGISVSNEHQLLKEDLSALLSGFVRDSEGGAGYDLYTVHGWDYPALLEVYAQAAKNAREAHVPALVHVIEMTQPQGHSTSGSHERYKSPERLAWEEEHDGLARLRAWLLAQGFAEEKALSALEKEDRTAVRQAQQAAWHAYNRSVEDDKEAAAELIELIAHQSEREQELMAAKEQMMAPRLPMRRDIMETIFEVLLMTREERIPAVRDLIRWRDGRERHYRQLYSSDLTSVTDGLPSEKQITSFVPPIYDEEPTEVPGYTILNRYFDLMLGRDPRIIAFGEDVGYIGGVNQTMAGLQAKYGALRVSDTGIRETTILGQAIGMAMRGLRPIAEIQYLDYILYALQIMSDDLATLRWRTVGGQIAPVIVRTRGHRLEGVWHSGSPMSSVIHLLRGVHVLVPRDMTRAAGMYNTLLQTNDPALVVEVLNGYRRKEPLPKNLDEIMIPVGVPEILREGDDVTLVTYGAMCQHAMDAADDLAQVDIGVEVIDVQSLLPFDIRGIIGDSLKKTNRLICVDEDVPGGMTACMLQQILEKQNGYHWLDAKPRTLTAQQHRPAYGSDGNYFSKPNREQIFYEIFDMMNEADPVRFPRFYK